MKIIILYILISFSAIAYSQQYFNKTFDTDNYQEIGSDLIVEDSTYLVSCYCDYNNIDRLTYFRINHLGDSILISNYGNDSLSFFGAQQDGIIITNNYYYDVGGNYDNILFTKIDKITLDTVWLNWFDIENSELGRTGVKTSDGGFLLGGFTQPYDGVTYGTARWFVIKTDSLGNEEWRNTYLTGDLREISPTQDGGFLLIGFYIPSSGFNYQHQIIKIDVQGNVIWQKRFGTPESEGLLGGFELEDSTIIVYGDREDYYYLAKLSSIGDTIWESVNGYPTNSNIIRNLELLPDGSFIACGQGSAQGTNSTSVRGTIMKFCPNGELLWERKYGAVDFPSYLYDIELTDDGGFIATGSTKGTTGTQDLWVIKVDSLGCDTLGCAVAPDPCPEDTTLSISTLITESDKLEVFPNPFSETLTVKFNVIASATKQSIKLYDLIGKEITSFRYHSTRNDEIILNVSQLQKGIYILEVEGVGRTKVIKE